MKQSRKAAFERAKGRDPWLAATAVGGFAALVWLERRSALRASTESKSRRVARNLAVAGFSAAALQIAERPVTRRLTRWAESRRAGILYLIPAGSPAAKRIRDAAAVVLLDYTLYWWHVLEHRWPLLYRFHIVHHADLDLDASTALRFHFGELLASVPWRAAQVLIIGVSPRALRWWQRLLFASIVFHHSNLRLPVALEAWLSRLIVTPRLHGTHHSIVREEQNSNWSSGLTVWDRLHGSYRADVPQHEIEIGVPAFRNPEDVTLPKMIAQPLQELPPWRRPDGIVPHRSPVTVQANRSGLLAP